jgi:hypothetical protein
MSSNSQPGRIFHEQTFIFLISFYGTKCKSHAYFQMSPGAALSLPVNGNGAAFICLSRPHQHLFLPEFLLHINGFWF